MPDEQPFRTIIAGCNGEPAGRDALALAGVLAGPEHAELMAIGVYLDPMLPFPRHATLRSDCEQTLRDERDALAPGARIRAVGAASPAAALLHAAEREHADLLVLGSERHSDAGRVRAGRHARQLLHDAPCAIALAPHGYATLAGPPQRIAVGYDASPEGATAVARARELAAAAGASLRVVTAVDPTPIMSGGFGAVGYLPVDWSEIAADLRAQAREQLDALLAAAPGVEAEVVDGDPATALCDISRGVDLLVVGSRRWGPVQRLVAGSVAEYVARHARCAVLVVPRGAGRVPPAGGATAPARSAAAA